METPKVWVEYPSIKLPDWIIVQGAYPILLHNDIKLK